MLEIDCQKCDGRCCTSGKRKLYVVLTPQERESFRDSSTKITTSHGNLTVLKKSEYGNCIFYDEKENICRTYRNRPFECRTHPLQMYFDFDAQQIAFGLDGRTCPKTNECSPEKIEGAKKEWIDQKLPLDWLKAYSTFDPPTIKV